MANEKLQACYELHALCNHFAALLNDAHITTQCEQLGMQTCSATLLKAVSSFHDVVQLNTERVTSELH
jgi:hypothetical protein